MRNVEITVGEVYSRITYAPPKAFALIRDICRARPEGYIWMPKYQEGVWDGYISLLKGIKTFPTGLLSYVRYHLKNEGWSVDATEKGIRKVQLDIIKVPQGVCRPTLLRDYQVDAVERLLKAERGVARMATNAGKTVVFGALIKLLGNKDALVVVHSRDLLYQTRDRLAEYLDRDVGLIGDGYRDDDDVLVATIQTLHSLIGQGYSLSETFSENKIVVTDEAHHIGANTIFDDLLEIPGWYRYGFSGTPLDRGVLNDLKLIAATGPLVVDVGNAQLIEEEWSAKPIILLHDVENTVNWELNYYDAYREQVVESYPRNNQVCDIAVSEVSNGSVLIIVTQILHGQLLYELLKDEVQTVFVCGDSPMAQRTAVLKSLGRGDKIVAIATQIFDEGVDVPALDTLILACAGKSHIKLLQRIGRGLRKKEGENVVHIHDFLDSGNKHLLKHTDERYEVYQREGFEVILVEKESSDE